MIPREDLKKLLQDRLIDVLPMERVERLVSDIIDLEGGWEELNIPHRDMGYSVSVNCSDICWLADQIDRGAVIKLYRKLKPRTPDDTGR